MALVQVVEASFSFTGTMQIARILGCVDTTASGPRPLDAGSTCPGFHVAAIEERKVLALAGQHRFSRYALIFNLEDRHLKGTKLNAETRAEFPDATGRLYRSLVIGSGGHVFVTRSVLAAVKRRAEGRSKPRLDR